MLCRRRDVELPVLRVHQSGRHRIRPMPSAAVAAAARQLQQGVRPLDLRRVLQHLHVLAVHQFGLRLLGLLHPRLTAALASPPAASLTTAILGSLQEASLLLATYYARQFGRQLRERGGQEREARSREEAQEGEEER